MAYLETPTVSIGGGHRLRADAARQWKLMDSAFRKARGHNIPITSSTRTMARQDYLYQGWINRLPGFNLALPSGKSTHNFGTAIDAGGNAGIEGTADHNWLVKNGPKYGWHWTGRDFSHREAWHFDYQPGTATITATSSKPATNVLKEIGLDMSQIGYVHRAEPGYDTEWMICGQEIPGGYNVTTSVTVAVGWGALYGTPDGDSWKALTRDQYIQLQLTMAKMNKDWVAQQKKIFGK
ncbi:M15 family metallopeptidase [Paramicrobacterium chengjingii]|uniref:M15 family metallopeptidase n=1 Tax=Paramicrobacterium chengjingii TaxID=2769067 RepID=A0ABX6YMT8_9MICO|nr:M15 family metallopeptidase [Microbacterium chengjingii]QPZ39691.1 M15 family metallopeptidase [Microbacterium chengjingii]